jgi:anti-sigma-K factor RskA
MSDIDRSRHSARSENVAPYVLGALPESEHEEFLAHIGSCKECREDVAALQVVAASLPASVPQLHAPGDLKGRVMRTVESEASLRGARGEPTMRRPSERRARRRFPIPALGAAAGAIAVIAILAVVALSSGGGGADTRVIQAQVSIPRARASLTISHGRAQLNVAGIPQAALGRVYEVWVEKQGSAHPTDVLFNVSSTGIASVGVPGKLDGVTAVMVTSEPDGGSRVPTTPPVILARLS